MNSLFTSTLTTFATFLPDTAVDRYLRHNSSCRVVVPKKEDNLGQVASLSIEPSMKLHRLEGAVLGKRYLLDLLSSAPSLSFNLVLSTFSLPLLRSILSADVYAAPTYRPFSKPHSLKGWLFFSQYAHNDQLAHNVAFYVELSVPAFKADGSLVSLPIKARVLENSLNWGVLKSRFFNRTTTERIKADWMIARHGNSTPEIVTSDLKAENVCLIRPSASDAITFNYPNLSSGRVPVLAINPLGATDIAIRYRSGQGAWETLPVKKMYSHLFYIPPSVPSGVSDFTFMFA